ncbi:MAG: DegT/DnrJ/EryC1/StrS family aminotransferase, partial [Oscillospiraceae bacterium]|nr:DegT/DnrJ/EryC1/StrS family aminotransferase [Oscillospiraceae bacterium]
MEFRDLKRQYNALREEITKRTERILEESRFINGREVGELEGKLAEYVGVKHCITCGNGTDALRLALQAADIGEGEGVIVPNFTFFATAEAVMQTGAVPIFTEPEENGYNISAKGVERELCRAEKEGSVRIKAVLAADMFGLPANYPELERIAKKYNVLLFEDGAQSFGGKIGEQKAGSFGAAAATSFFPSKPLGCYGDGGAVFTNDEGIAAEVRSLREHGKGSDKYDNVRVGCNSRLDTLQAAVLLAKLAAYKRYELEAAQKIAEIYSVKLGAAKLETPKIPTLFYSAWAQYTVRLRSKAQRDELQTALKNAGIPSNIYYPKPLSSQKACLHLQTPADITEKTQNLCDRV